MNDKLEITRKKFIRWTGLLLLLPAAGLWKAMVDRTRDNNLAKAVTIPVDSIPNGNSRNGDVLIHRTGDNISVFSARCTHLGCLIRDLKDDEWVCPCHGSRYDPASGEVITGPSVKNLDHLVYTLDETSQKLIIELPG